MLAGCSIDADAGDGENDSFLTGGKADDPSSLSPAEAAGVLALVNAAPLAELDDDGQISSKSTDRDRSAYPGYGIHRDL